MRPAHIRLNTGDPSNARRLHALITANLEEGHLLPRTLRELGVHAERFTVAVKGRTIVGCAELAPLSPSVAEVRSLAVDASARGTGVGTRIVEGLRRRARPDRGLRVSETAAVAAAVFTIDRAQAAPAVLSREHLERSESVARAIVVNSGCANACTGDEGYAAAREMASETARLIGCPVPHVL